MIDTVIHNDCLSVLRGMADNSVDAIVTDPPAGIHFMNKEFDHDKGGRDHWIAWLRDIMIEAKRVIRPGGHALVWALPRTSHWTATALEDAGWEIRDCCYHIQGQGFPKSLNLGNGQGTALKPAVECWWLVRKPLAEPSIAANVLAWGTGGLAIDQCRVASGQDYQDTARENDHKFGGVSSFPSDKSKPGFTPAQGRFPSHLLLSHSLWCVPRGTKRVRGNGGGEPSIGKPKPRGPNTYGQYELYSRPKHEDADGMETVEAYDCAPDCPIAELDRQSGVRKSGGGDKHGRKPSTFCASTDWEAFKGTSIGGDTGGASRYFTNFPPDDYTPFGSTGLQSVPCCLLCGKKNDIMDETKSKESTISCNTIVSTAEKNSRPGALPLNTALRNAQERQQPESEGKKQRLSTPASTAESNGWNTQAITDHSVQKSVWGLERWQLAQLVSSAANLCNSCATDIAHDLVRLKLKQDHPLPPGLDSITEIIANILRQNLVAYVEHLESTDTTPTIANLTRLFGSVQHAINDTTMQVSNAPINELDQIVPYRYISKASRAERNRGCEDLPERMALRYGEKGQGPLPQQTPHVAKPETNNHPTVKSTSLMRWLIRLITPPDGIVLDPFCGSGSTLVAAIAEGKHFIGIEQDESYTRIAEARIAHAFASLSQPSQVSQEYDCAPDCPVRILGEQSGESVSTGGTGIASKQKTKLHGWKPSNTGGFGDTGTAARYFQQFPPDSLWCDEVSA